MAQESNFTHNLTKELKLDKLLDHDVAYKLTACPYYYGLLYHGIVKFCKTDGSFFSKNEFLREGDEFGMCVPQAEGNDLNIYRVTKMTVKPDVQSITIKNIKPSSKAALFDQLMTITYHADHKQPKIAIEFSCNTTNSIAIELAKIIMFKQSLKRINDIAISPKEALKNLSLISTLEFGYLDKVNFYGMPYAVAAELYVPVNIQKLREFINKFDFLYEIFPTMIESTHHKDTEFQPRDQFKVKLNNMKQSGFNFTPYEEEVAFCIQTCGDKVDVVSNPNVLNFDQLGYSFVLSKINQNTTSVKIHINYNKSNLFSVAKGFQTFASFFTTKMPDPILFLTLSARSMLDTTIRHFSQSVKKHLDVEVSAKINPVVEQEAVSSSKKEKKSSRGLRKK